jgi:glycosyltransferase involved in cell wall biosynthesis
MSAIGMPTGRRYIIVSPVKDEERFVELTLRSVVCQTVKPVLWIVVDDASEDRTPEIVARYLETEPVLRMVRRERGGMRQTGSPVIRAFNHGCTLIGETGYDYIVKLDCDLSFPPDYFEKLLARFIEDDRLGIASGVYFEQAPGDAWKAVVMPAYHAAGACKVVRRTCFEQIGGFVTAPGWDTVDEIRAMSNGWKTGHFAELQMRHHKPEGSGIGVLRTSVMHGEIYYLTGGSLVFFALKVLRRMGSKPYGLGALVLMYGYLKSLWQRRARLVTPREALTYRSMLQRRLMDEVKAVFARS